MVEGNRHNSEGTIFYYKRDPGDPLLNPVDGPSNGPRKKEKCFNLRTKKET